MRCRNSGCNKSADPDVSLGARVINTDGDFVCSADCEQEYKQKRDTFISVTIHDDATFDKWLSQ